MTIKQYRNYLLTLQLTNFLSFYFAVIVVVVVVFYFLIVKQEGRLLGRCKIVRYIDRWPSAYLDHAEPTCACFSITTIPSFTRTKIRAKSILTNGVGITDSDGSTTFVDIWKILIHCNNDYKTSQLPADTTTHEFYFILVIYLLFSFFILHCTLNKRQKHLGI